MKSRALLLVAAVVAILGDRPAQAAPGRLDSGYVIEFPITGSPVQRSFLGDTWWELAWVIPMDAPSKMLVYPTGFCMSRRLPLTGGKCLRPVHDPDTVVTQVTCLSQPDNSAVVELKPDYLGIGNNVKCDRRYDDTRNGFQPLDSCLHPAVTALGGSNFSYFLSDVVGGKIPQSAYEAGLPYSCRWFADPGTIRNPRIRFTVEHWEKGTFANGGEQYALLDPPGRSLGQRLVNATASAAYTMSNVGWGTLKVQMRELSGAPDVKVVVPRLMAGQRSWSRNNFHHEPPNDVIGMSGTLAFRADVTALANPGPWRRFFIEATLTSGLFSPRVVLEYRPVAALTPEIELGNGGLAYLYSSLMFPVGTRTLEIFNEGGKELVITSLTLTGRDAAVFGLTMPALPLRVPAYGSTRLALTFKPPTNTGIASYEAELEVVSNSIDSQYATGGLSVFSLDGSFVP